MDEIEFLKRKLKLKKQALFLLKGEIKELEDSIQKKEANEND